MRNNYFEKLVIYMKKLYHIEIGLKKLRDARINSTYNTALVITPVLFWFLFRIKSFNELGPKLVIDFEMYKAGVDSVSKNEGELTVAKRRNIAIFKENQRN